MNVLMPLDPSSSTPAAVPAEAPVHAAPQSQLLSTDPYHALYNRFERALALLCECAPYVDEEDYVEEIDALLTEACAHYPLRSSACGPYRELVRQPAGDQVADVAMDEIAMDEINKEAAARATRAP